MRENKIFVSIASYRDARCSDTLAHLFQMAKHPERVYVGLCQQNKKGMGQEECLPNHQDNVRVVRLDYKQARGPTYARYVCARLYRGEDFFMQIDSHCLFVQDWDEKAIAMIHLTETHTPSHKVVLSHYPPEYKDYKENPGSDDPVTHINRCYFNDDGILSFHGAVFKKPEVIPKRNAFIAGGFIFARGAFVREVPFDPHLPYLFTGEELLLSTRSFTHGWDVYTPNRNLVYHAYTRKGEPKFWDDHRLDTKEVHLKVKMLTGLIPMDLSKIKNKTMRESMDHYGQGSARTLSQFYELVGVDVQHKTISKPLVEFYCDSCHSSFNALVGWIWILVVIFAILVAILVARLRSKK
jgi:Glycosyltransferase (GlcNAc)